MGDVEVLSGVSAVVFAVLLLAGGLLPGPPPLIDSGPTAIVDFYRRRGGAQQRGNFLIGLSAIPFLLFLPGAVNLSRQLEGSVPFVSTAVPAAGVVALAAALAGTALFQGRAVRAASLQDPAVVGLIEVAARTARLLSYFGQAVLIGSISWLLITGTAVGRGLGLVGLVVALLVLATTWLILNTSASAHLLALVGLLSFALWCVALGVAMAAQSLT